MRRRDDEYRWMLNHAVPRCNAHGDFLGFIGSCLDITQRKLDELELNETRRQLVHLSRVSSLGALSSAFAHELNQPLGAILSNAQAALRYLHKDPPNIAEVIAILRDIVAADRRAADVIGRMRVLLQRGQAQFSPVDIHHLINEVLALMRSELMHRATAVDFIASHDLPHPLGDRVPLQQVIINLLMNAAEAMQGSPSGSRRILVRTERHDANIEIHVSDHGTGLGPKTSLQLFNPFFSTKPGGLGIGLSISRSIIDAHGGRLWAENNTHGGATFHVSLPVVENFDPAPNTSTALRASTADRHAAIARAPVTSPSG